MTRYFNSEQLPLAGKAFVEAERQVMRYFRLSEEQLRRNRYDVKTLAFLAKHEVKDYAFAHLCKYSYEKPSARAQNGKDNFDFYRICLQDNRILDAVERANSFVKFSHLMLYIAVHELIHVLRFENGDIDFCAPQEKKEKEEEVVHSLTRSTLRPLKNYGLEIVLDCFDSQFDICSLYSKEV